MDQKQLFAENLNKWLRIKGKTQADLIKEFGYSQVSVSDWCTGKKYPRIEKIQEIADYLGIWKSDLMDAKNNIENRIPVLGKIPAGIPIELIEDIEGYEDISEDMLKGGKEYFALKVKGDSMETKYRNDDTIIILKQSSCESGEDCIIMVNGDDGTFKRVFKTDSGITLQPLNSEYMALNYSNEDIENLPIKILGVVKQIRRDV
ncbi:MAG: S24 family peptidase [Clostridia bacterium]